MQLICHFTDVSSGFSNAPYKGLNLALHVKDNSLHVKKNRNLLQKRLGAKKLIFMDQIHGNDVEIVDFNSEILTCDAIITKKKNLALCVMVADCIPLLLYDKKEKVIAAIHAGRAGVFSKIAQKCIEKMQENFNSKPNNMIAYIGPHIKKCCYEVSGEVLEDAKTKYPDFVFQNHLDISGILHHQLESLHVNIKDVSSCTSCDKRFYSYRRDGITGRQVGVIMLKDLHV